MMIIGNGVSIDFINHINKPEIKEEINLVNLFDKGDCVPWPSDDVPGFLSYYHTPSLWTLGCRPGCKIDDALKGMENIMACANVFASCSQNQDFILENIYFKAYKELAQYLRYLFIYYNGKITDEMLKSLPIDDWGWYRFIKKNYEDDSVKKIFIISYNYDIFLERILKVKGIVFSVAGFDNMSDNLDTNKVVIIKPHGSIGFKSKNTTNKDRFIVKYTIDDMNGRIEDFCLDNDIKNKEELSSIITLIPPYGESERFANQWAVKLRERCIESAKKLQEDDLVIIGGLSYSYVDRVEIDRLLAHFNRGVCFKLVNPDINNVLDTVLNCMFVNVQHYTKSSVLGELKS